MVVRNACHKDILRQILYNPRRFIAIFLIVALGVAFFSGVRAASPDMKLTADQYFSDYNASDVQLLSTLGFNDGDVEALRKVAGVETVMPAYSVDSFLLEGDSSLLISFQSIDLDALKNHPDSVLNRPVLMEGRMPVSSGECLMDAELKKKGYKIGDVITIDTKDDAAISDSLNRMNYTIVGFARTVQYISLQRGTSSKGSGKLDGFVMIPSDNFTMDVYTQVYFKAENLTVSHFSKAYDTALDDLGDRIEKAGDVRNPERYKEVKAEAADKLDEANQKIADAKKQLSDAEQKILDGEEQLKEGEQKLAANRTDYNKKIADGQKQLDNAKAALAKAESELTAKEKELNEAGETLKQSRAQLADTKATLDGGEQSLAALQAQIQQLTALIASLPESDPQRAVYTGELTQAQSTYTQKRAELNAGWQQYNDSVKQADAAQRQLEEGESALTAGKKELAANKAAYEKNLFTFEQSKASGAKQLAKAQSKLDASRQELEDARKKYNIEHPGVLNKIETAENDLKDGEEQLSKLEEPVWYVVPLTQNVGFDGYKQDAERIAAIGLVFPLIFFLVAALVSLTNMTRMVEDDRNTIGVLKALGYGRMAIASKYLVYAGVAALGGIALGVAVGARLFPWVIFDAYGILYSLPSVLTPVDIESSVQAGVGALFCAVVPAYMVCQGELMSAPASLMRPRAPKEGKRILLERISFVWKRLNFSQKVTCRNIFRYKKRLLMTVLGIAGCTALVFTAFGLKDSIRLIVPLQYDEIQKYDMTVAFKDPVSSEQSAKIQTALINSGHVSATMVFHRQSLDVLKNGETKSISLIVPKDTAQFTKFIALRKRLGGQVIPLTDDGVVITEKFAKLMGIQTGDTITLRDEENKTVAAKVTGITENYVYHYVYMTPALYKQLYGTSPADNAMFGQLSDTSDSSENVLSRSLLQCDGVSAVAFNTAIRKSFNDMIGALNFVVLVLLVSAAALAFIVLFSLTSINVDERKRELATLKVLGFYDGETAMYLYRENILLTILGIGAGLVLGIFMLNFVLTTAEVDLVMFTRKMIWTNFVYSSLVTAGFAAAVNVIMSGVIKRINMVESMKSVE